MIDRNTFDVLLLISRPAAGKSEIIDHIKRNNILDRIRRYHIGDFEVLDDFPMLWTWFEEDAILARLGYPRLHTNNEEDFIGLHLWDLLIERVSLEYRKKVRDDPDFHRHKSIILEFARGSEHGGYKRAFRHLSREVVEKMAIMYINVSWHESRRKNRARYNPDRPDSILEHSLSDEKLIKLYQHDDWEEVSRPDPAFIKIHGIRVPYVVFQNEDDVTTQRSEVLSSRLKSTLGRLWDLYKSYRLGQNND